MTWAVAACAINTEGGAEIVAGWQLDALFLDYRPLRQREADVPFAWMVSHVPTGLGMFRLMTDLRQAKLLVEEVTAQADWAAMATGAARPTFLLPWLNGLRCGWCVAGDLIAPFSSVEHRPVLRVVK